MALSEVALANPPKPKILIGENYGHILSQSVQSLVAEIHKGNRDLSHFIDDFYELMQSQADPPLETIWVYSALSFHRSKIRSEELSDRVSSVKDLFQLISGCSSSCSASKSIALLAPVVFEVYKLVAELLGRDLGAKRVKKVVREVKSLIGGILGYVNVCCCKGLSEESDSNLIVSFTDLVGVWMEGKGGLESLLPLLSDEVRREINVGVSSVNYLAGVVVSEVFLLKLCLDLRVGNQGVELEKELRSLAVGSTTGFRCFYFFDILVKMLLEPTLPLTALLNAEDEIVLRRILYDATVLVEYSFLSPEGAIHHPAECVTSLAVRKLILICEALEFVRKHGDQKRAISYTSSYTSSRLPSQIIKYVTSQIGMEEEANRLVGSSPKALIKWLIGLEGQGARLFDDTIVRRWGKLTLDDSKADCEHKPESKKADAELFYIDNKGEEEGGYEDEMDANESMSAAFVAAAHTMRSKEDGARKRKEGISCGKKKKTKFLKNEFSDSSDSDRERLSIVSDGSSSESEVENPISDEEV